MKYKLYGNSNSDDVKIRILENRGICDVNRYLNLSANDVIPYDNLKNINRAVECFFHHYNKKAPIAILVDSDVDGYCSAAMVYRYIKRLDAMYPVSYILHTRAKAHGLSDDVVLPPKTKLLIIPDASTNDTEQCKEIRSQDIDIIILDHHEQERDNPNAIIVNNQISSNYDNKAFSGAGIVYKFLCALDAECWTEYAEDYLDLCAWANISDDMDMRSFETKYLVDEGLRNIKNEFLLALIEAQKFSMKGKITIHTVQWYLTPVLNGMIRVGSEEEKELVFRAMLGEYEEFDYKKRGSSSFVKENIYDRAARLCKNAKSRQDNARRVGTASVIDLVSKQSDNNKVIVADVTGILEDGLTGLIAIKIAEYFNKPCILLNEMKRQDGLEHKKIFGGSMRNMDHSPIDSFKDVINSCPSFNYCMGHANAAGVCIDEENVSSGIDELNERLKDVQYDLTYQVDYIKDINETDFGFVFAIAQLEDIVAKGIPKPLIAIENIALPKQSFSMRGKKLDTIQFSINEVEYIMFGHSELLTWVKNNWDDETVIFDLVGEPSINEFRGIKTLQVAIKDINIKEIKKSSNEDFDDDETGW